MLYTPVGPQTGIAVACELVHSNSPNSEVAAGDGSGCPLVVVVEWEPSIGDVSCWTLGPVSLTLGDGRHRDSMVIFNGLTVSSPGSPTHRLSLTNSSSSSRTLRFLGCSSLTE